MKTYNIISPSLEGILSDDHLYFEGVRRPSAIYAVRDGQSISTQDIGIMEKYFNDIYNLFLRKLSSFCAFGHADDEETAKIQALLQEMIKVKKLIEGAEENSAKNLV